MTHFALKYIGLPWVAGAQGPDSFDCWGFVRYIHKQEYGHNVPLVNVDPDNFRDVLNAFQHDAAFQVLYEIDSHKKEILYLCVKLKIQSTLVFGLTLMAEGFCIAYVKMVWFFRTSSL